jgi:hypothetical protein
VALMIYLWFESRISRRRAWKSVQLEQDEISPHIPSWRPGIQAWGINKKQMRTYKAVLFEPDLVDPQFIGPFWIRICIRNSKLRIRTLSTVFIKNYI